MTIASLTNRNDYVGNGSVSVYSYTFRIFSSSDLLVSKMDTNGVVTTLALTTDYTVSGVGDLGGGSITLVAGNLPASFALTIRRVVSLLQPTDLRNQGDFFPEAHEDEFDRLTMMAQQFQDVLSRSLILPETEAGAGFNLTIPAKVKRALMGMGFDVNGNPIAIAFDGPTVAAALAAAAASATAAAASQSAAATSASSASSSAAAASASATAAAASATQAATNGGWVNDGNTWTYVSATSFSVSGDQTAVYQVGDRIRLTQTTVKYFYITALSFGGGITTVTITGGSDYSLANAAITSPGFSKVFLPNGFPEWFNYTATVGGWSGTTTDTLQFRLQGRICTVVLGYSATSHTSNATTFTYSAPISAAAFGVTNPIYQFIPGVGLDNGSSVTSCYASVPQAGGSTISLYNGLGGAWTASGLKNFPIGFFTYTI